VAYHGIMDRNSPDQQLEGIAYVGLKWPTMEKE